MTPTERVLREAHSALQNALIKGRWYDTEERDIKSALNALERHINRNT